MTNTKYILPKIDKNGTYVLLENFDEIKLHSNM